MSTLNFTRCNGVPIYSQSKEKKPIYRQDRAVSLAPSWKVPTHRIKEINATLNRVATIAREEMQPT